jgi:uncharacterized protein DUF6129
MIEESIVQKVASLVQQKGPSEETVKELRTLIPEIHFTYCFDDDVCGPKPAHEDEKFNIYLVDGTSHCASFTSYLEAASGLVIAELDDFCA